MRNDKNVPKIRLKEFDAEWSSSTLGDEGSFYYGRSCPKWSVTKDATIPCIRYGELYTKFGIKIDKVYSYTNISPDNLRFSNGSEVLIPRVGEDPKDYNHCTWLSIPNVAIGEMISVYNTKNNPLFTSIMLNATMQDEFAKRVEGGSVTNLYYEKLKNIKVFFPSKLEQEKIGSYFENLDNIISLQKQKYEKLLDLKKAMLNKLFPKEGEATPEIRFNGFTEDWGKRKIKDICSISNGCMNTQDAKEKGMYPFFIRSEQVMKSDTYVYDEEAILTPGEGRIGEIFHYIDGKYTAHQRVYRLFNFIEEVFPTYLLHELKNNFKKHALQNSSTATAPSIRMGTIADYEFMLPNLDEQKAIGEYFSRLDNLINLNKEKLDKLKNVKSSLLDNMFV